MKRYYLVDVTTMYDGLEFSWKYACGSNKIVTQKEIEKDVNEEFLHEGTGEEIERVSFIEIPKKDFDVLKKYHI